MTACAFERMLFLVALACLVSEGRPAASASALVSGAAEGRLTGMLNGGCIAEVAHPVIEGDGRRLEGTTVVLLQNNIRLHLRWGGPARPQGAPSTPRRGASCGCCAPQRRILSERLVCLKVPRCLPPGAAFV